MDFFSGLNEAQRQAASHVKGPLVVFAGAGSGKTRIITSRIAYLIEQGVAPWEILAVTFTNKAAGEMKERVLKMSYDGARCHIATFHSACARWLREFATELGFTADFSIYDDSDSNAALKKIIKDMVPNVELAPVVADMKAFIHMAKMRALFPSDIENRWEEFKKKVPDGGVQVYRRYQEYLALCNAMDFDDLLLNMILLLRRSKRVCQTLQKRYQFLLIDEFQDTNQAQLELVQMLAKDHENIFVVGDDDQSIYSWRGATPANILNFEKLYPKARRITMSQNYRSTSNIVAAASAMVSNNKVRAAKQLFSEIPSGHPIEYHQESDGEMEAWYACDVLKQELVQYDYSDFAIFYRTNAQSRLIEEALRRENIPYRIFGTVRFYDRLEIKDVLAYLRLVLNEDDDISLKRIINVPGRGIGKKATEELEAEAARRGLSLVKTARQVVTENLPKLGAKLSILLTILDTINQQLKDAPLDSVVSLLLDTIDYKNYLRKKFPEDFLDKNENLHELSSALASFANRNPGAGLSTWMQQVSLERDTSDDDGVMGVSLMTLHTAKGLEFKRVFILGVEQGLIPHRNNIEDVALLEEERRLFYVGMTRAREKLTLLGANERMMFNQFQMNDPSQFLREIPREYLKVLKAPSIDLSAHEATDKVRYDYSDDIDFDDLTPGSEVRHPTYGKGVIEDLENNFGKVKALVRFMEFGLRKVSLSQLQPL